MNALGRTTRLLAGGEWQKDLHWFIAGIGAAATGYALASAASSGAFIGVDGATEGLIVGGAVAWNAGMAFLVIDAIVTGFGNDKLVASTWRPGKVELAGVWLAPEGRGATGGLSLRF